MRFTLFTAMTTAALSASLAATLSPVVAVPPTVSADLAQPRTSTSSAPDSWSDKKLPTLELVPGVDPGPKVAPDEAYLRVTDWGYRFIAGAGNNKLTVTAADGKLRFHDRAIKRWTNIPGKCTRVKVAVGRAVVCKVPEKHQDGAFLELWPRLGHDTIDTSALPSRWRTFALTDAGKDVVRTGAGRDFVNAAADRDRAYGGPGDDWIRMGINNNRASGGAGNDKLVGGDHDDTLRGGEGRDSVGGLAGNDILYGNAGADVLSGTVGHDIGYRQGRDTLRNIDVVR